MLCVLGSLNDFDIAGLIAQACELHRRPGQENHELKDTQGDLVKSCLKK